MKKLVLNEAEADLLFAVLHGVTLTGNPSAAAAAQAIVEKLNAECSTSPSGATPPPEVRTSYVCCKCPTRYKEPVASCAVCGCADFRIETKRIEPIAHPGVTLGVVGQLASDKTYKTMVAVNVCGDCDGQDAKMGPLCPACGSPNISTELRPQA